MATIETGNIITRFAFWNPSTWAIPELYWDTISPEQRIHAICKQLGKVIAYADYLGVNVDDIASRLKAIEDGQLDDVIVAAIEEWFEDNQPTIIAAISALDDALPISDFNGDNTVKDAIDAMGALLPASDFDSSNTVKGAIDAMGALLPASDFDSSNTVKDAIDALTTTVSALSDFTPVIYDSLEYALTVVNNTVSYVKTLSYYADGNSGGALYKVSETIPTGYYETASSGVYLEIISPDNVAQFGAVGDGSTLDTVAIQKAIDNMDLVNFEAGKTYRVSNLVIKDDDKVLRGNGCTIQNDNYQTDTLAAPLNIGDSSIRVNNPDFFHVNQTALIYNVSNTPSEYQIIVTGVSGDIVSFKSYKPFKHGDTTADTSPYAFPTGSTIYTGVTIFTISKELYVSGSGITKNVSISGFNIKQSTNSVSGVGNWAQLAYGVLSYRGENIRFTDNNVIGGAMLFLMIYGYHKDVFVINNAFTSITKSQAVCAHWDMIDISPDNRTHNFMVCENVFTDCPYAIIYSSVDGGVCQGNEIVNKTVANKLGIYIYGGDISMYTSYSSYTQEDFYSNKIMVADNVISSETNGGAGVSAQGATDCVIRGNNIKMAANAITSCASNNLDVCGNVINHNYTYTTSTDSAIRVYGKINNMRVHENTFNCGRIVKIDALLKKVNASTNDTVYWGYTDSTLYIENNSIVQSVSAAIIVIGGTTETSHAPTQLKDVPQILMFDNNRIIQTSKNALNVFNFNDTLKAFITTYTNLITQMYAYNNISYGLTMAYTEMNSHVGNSGNITMS